MTAKEYLLKIRDLKEIVDTYDEEYQTLMARLTSVTYRQKEMNIMQSKEDRFAENVDKMSQMKIMLTEKLREFAELRIEAEGYVRQIEDFRLQTVLIKYFFQHKTLEQIAVDMDLSYRWVCELKDTAVVEFSKIFEKSAFTS